MAGFGALPPGAPARPAPSAGQLDLQQKMQQASAAGVPPMGAKGPPPAMPMGRPGGAASALGAMAGAKPMGAQASQAALAAKMQQAKAAQGGAGPMARPPVMGSKPPAPPMGAQFARPGGMSGGAFGMKPQAPQRGGAFGAPTKAPTSFGSAQPFAGSRGNR